MQKTVKMTWRHSSPLVSHLAKRRNGVETIASAQNIEFPSDTVECVFRVGCTTEQSVYLGDL